MEGGQGRSSDHGRRGRGNVLTIHGRRGRGKVLIMGGGQGKSSDHLGETKICIINY